MKEKYLIDEFDLEIVVMITSHDSKKKCLPILILETKVEISATKQDDIWMLGANVYCAVSGLKKAKVFLVSRKNHGYLAEKET